jgi:NitT/TauT family transport system substrate-binding protein
LQVALQAGHVDMIVVDWLWVARQRAAGDDWSFVPFSNAVGALIAAAVSSVRDVPDLAGRTLGVAGSPLDKSWLILRAYATQHHGIDLNARANISFGAHPLLAEQMKAGRLDALLTIGHLPRKPRLRARTASSPWRMRFVLWGSATLCPTSAIPSRNTGRNETLR